jgi:type IV secretory pathway VirB10-like protein
MKKIAISRLRIALLSAVLAAAPFAYSQTSPPAPQTGPASEASPMFQRHHAMAGIMKDMVVAMSQMQEEMSRGEPSPEARKQMATKMKRMSQMMRRMSGLADRPTMKEPEMRRQFEQMQRQMDAMSKH